MNDIFDLLFPKTYICSWSGGKDSTAAIILAHENNEPLNKIIMSEVVFDKKRNISGELPEHINWVYNIAIPRFEKWGYEVEILKSEKDYLDIFYSIRKKSKYPERIGKLNGFVFGGKCTANNYLKLKPITDYYKKLNIDVVQYVGIAIDEPKRLKKLKGTNKNLYWKNTILLNKKQRNYVKNMSYYLLYMILQKEGDVGFALIKHMKN